MEKEILVDDCDLYLLDKYKWYIRKLKISEIQKGNKRSEKTKLKISDGLKKAYYEHRR